MHGIVGFLPIAQVAAGICAVARSDVEVVVVVDVTTSARHVGMFAGQQKTRRAVIELCAKPTVKIVAALAIRSGEVRAGGGVRGICGVLPILEVAGIALCGEAVENSRGELRVARVALHRSVGTEKREAILVILHLLHGDVPALHGVALRAVWTHLAAVNVGVTIGAVFRHIRKNRLAVTGNALRFFVHAAQGIAGLAVIEFRHSADRPPAGGGVAVFAWDFEGTVRVACGLFLRAGGMRREPSTVSGGREGKERPERELE